MSVGTALEEQGHDVTISEGFTDGFDYYGVGPTTPEYPYAKAVLSMTNARVIIGGPHASEKCLLDGFDAVVIGDGEFVAEKAFMGGKVFYGKELPLDKYPIIDRGLVSGYRYQINGIDATSILTARGCPYRCAFCSKTNSGVRFRSAKNVIKEIRQLQYKAIMFYDDIFIMNKPRLKKICKCLKELGIIWRCFVRADLVSEDVIKLIADHGCVEVGMGIESGSDTILKIINKGETTADIKKAIKIIKSFGIRVKGFFIVGLPGESRETLAETRAFLRDVQLDDFDFTIFRPYPGSPIYNNKEKYDIEWDDSDKSKMFYKGKPNQYPSIVRTSKLSSDEIVAARDSMYA